MTIDFQWQPYRLFPYEKVLAARELRTLSGTEPVETKRGLSIPYTNKWKEIARQTTYFAGATLDGLESCTPLQTLLEASANGYQSSMGGDKPRPQKRQSTRYSAHGLHEYRGKFNPQIVRATLNILNASPRSRVFDPFCGSGTTLVECAHSGYKAIGFDINPLAVYVSNAKLTALSIEATALDEALIRILEKYQAITDYSFPMAGEREEYLQKWFTESTLRVIENLKCAVVEEAGPSATVFLTIASDLLRDYSLQEPADLRIRRRLSPFPDVSFMEAFKTKAQSFIHTLSAAQSILGVCKVQSQAQVLDSRTATLDMKAKVDIGITSPPYATALPYIDTQRLSLVWLDLCSPSELKALEAHLTGSREFARGEKAATNEVVFSNAFNLPEDVYGYVLSLAKALSERDGFRRQAVPFLLYRYFSDMKKIFEQIKPMFKSTAPFALVVGHNHTTLGGKRFDIDTPHWLTQLATTTGWEHEESIPLQTYARYDIHSANSVKEETLLILRNK